MSPLDRVGSVYALRFQTVRTNYGRQPWSWNVTDNNYRKILAASETYAAEAGARDDELGSGKRGQGRDRGPDPHRVTLVM